MAFNLKFWKREAPEQPPEFQMPEQQMPAQAPQFDQVGMPRSGPGITEPPADFEQSFQQRSIPQAFQQPQFSQQQQPVSSEQQLQLISAKLDTIKAQLETILQRLDRLERGDHPYQQRWRTNT